MTGREWSPALPLDEVAERAAMLRRRIDGISSGADVRIVAVTKGFGPDTVATALRVGLTDLGENYAAELSEKASGAAWPAASRVSGVVEPAEAEPMIPGELAGAMWHFLGAVQRRHVGSIARWVHLWHGVCRAEEGGAIAAHSPGARVLVQVEMAGRTERRGVAPGDVERLVEDLAARGVTPVGIMALGIAGDSDATRQVFRRAAHLARNLALPEVSMGMSDDVDIAAREGATIVRVGRALFGERPAAHASGGPPPK